MNVWATKVNAKDINKNYKWIKYYGFNPKTNKLICVLSAGHLCGDYREMSIMSSKSSGRYLMTLTLVARADGWLPHVDSYYICQ